MSCGDCTDAASGVGSSLLIRGQDQSALVVKPCIAPSSLLHGRHVCIEGLEMFGHYVY